MAEAALGANWLDSGGERPGGVQLGETSVPRSREKGLSPSTV